MVGRHLTIEEVENVLDALENMVVWTNPNNNLQSEEFKSVRGAAWEVWRKSVRIIDGMEFDDDDEV